MEGTEKNQMQEVEELCSLLTPIQKKDRSMEIELTRLCSLGLRNAKACTCQAHVIRLLTEIKDPLY